jgi:glyceraldehyde 3-phosphate dehydrogenase
MATKVAINGLGRIGRAAFKILMDTDGLELTAVNDLAPADNLAYLLKHDSVHATGAWRVAAGQDVLEVDESRIRLYCEKDPARLPWRELGIDLVLECTGAFRRAEELQKHLDAGAGRVILSAPAKGEGVEMVVHAVNRPAAEARLISCASCTTNCITPVMEVMDRHLGVQKALMTTIHAYTSSQALVDSPRRKWRRGRAAAVSFVPTTTGAAKATTRVLPRLEGRFDGIAVRGPVPVGSLADMVFLTARRTTAAALNDLFRQEAASPAYAGILGVSETPLVSADIIQDPRASVVDLTMTQVVDGDLVKVLSWYDNEWGYASQMIREAQRLAGQG